MKNKISWWRTSFGNNEIKAISKSILLERISQGPEVEKLEKKLSEMLNCKYVIATTSGSMALLMSCMAANIKPGDEVIIPNRTWIATAHAPLLLGAKVKLIDVKKNIPIIDEKLIEKQINKKTKAIILVHMGGRCANNLKILRIAKKYNIVVIEDAAQALGSKNKYTTPGKNSDMACYSFSVAKIISTGQGGFITTNNQKHYDYLKSIRTHGLENIINNDNKWPMPGFNFRFNDILASIGIQQLKKIDSNISKVIKIYKLYENGLKDCKNIKLIRVKVSEGEIPLYVEALCKERIKLQKFLIQNGIEIRLFYPDLNEAKYLDNNKDSFPNSKKFGKYGVYLPSGPDQTKSNILKVINSIKKFDSFI